MDVSVGFFLLLYPGGGKQGFIWIPEVLEITRIDAIQCFVICRCG